MNIKKTAIMISIVGAFVGSVGTLAWADVPQQYDDFFFWRLGHMDGPHDESKALGISRDGKVAVGSTLVVDFRRAWRMDIDWALISPDPRDGENDDNTPPLYNELQVQEDIGVVVPSQPSAAYAASNMTELAEDSCDYYKYGDVSQWILNWCGSKPVGTLNVGTVSYSAQWLLPVQNKQLTGEEIVENVDYVKIPDFGGGLADMKALAVTTDGTVMVGYGSNKRGQQAFRADMTGVDAVTGDPLPILQTLTITDAVSLQSLQSSVAQDVSADGFIITGYGGTKTGNRAFVTDTTLTDWTVDVPVYVSTLLPNLTGGKFAEAYAMTPDGAVIAGRSDSPLGPQACIWFKVDESGAFTTDPLGTWVVKGLGGLSKGGYDAVAYGVAYKNDPIWGDLMVVGRSKTILYPSEAFVWAGNPVLEPDGEEGAFIGYMYDLEYILIKSGAGTASDMGSSWILNEATGISADGTRIVGWGTNPEQGIEAFAVTGYPSELILVLDGETGGEPDPKPKPNPKPPKVKDKDK